MFAKRTWLWVLLAAFGAAIVYATLAPESWQVRTGLHWLTEHFLIYFTIATIACLIWPRPMLVAAVLIPLSAGLEAAQLLTPGRTADLATALSAATGVASAALLTDVMQAIRKSRRKV